MARAPCSKVCGPLLTALGTWRRVPGRKLLACRPKRPLRLTGKTAKAPDRASARGFYCTVWTGPARAPARHRRGSQRGEVKASRRFLRLNIGTYERDCGSRLNPEAKQVIIHKNNPRNCLPRAIRDRRDPWSHLCPGVGKADDGVSPRNGRSKWPKPSGPKSPVSASEAGPAACGSRA